MKKRIVVMTLWLSMTMAASAQYNYITNNGTITITGYTGGGGSVTIPATINGLTVTSIGTNAFAHSPISSVTTPGSVTNIGDSAFLFNFLLQSATFSPGLISIGSNSFSECQALRSLTIPSTVTTIGDFAFDADTALTSVSIPNGVVHIGGAAFGLTGLGSVTLPPSVTDLGDNPFESCSSLTAITVATNNPAYTNVNGVLFDKSQTALLCYPAGHSGTAYTISNTVTTIGGAAFEGSSSLSNIVIPSSVTSIGDAAFFGCTGLTTMTIPANVGAIGNAALGNCYRLTVINVDSNNTTYASPGGVLYDHAQTFLLAFPAANGSNAYTIPATVTNIGDFAFFESGLAGIAIPSNVISIGTSAFAANSSLTNVTLASGLTSIGDLAFNTCAHLKTVNLPDGILSIGEGAFDTCTALTNMTVPASATNLGVGVFEECTLLTNVTLEDGLTSIGSGMFEFCSSLHRLTIPASVTNIGSSAFSGDTKLGLYFEGNPPVVGQSAFSSSGPITIYYLPNASGWSTNYGGRPTTIWQPAILTTDGFFGMQGGQFGFNISWASNLTVTVQAKSDLASTNWTSLQSCTLTNGTFNFSDATSGSSGQKFYRLSWP